MYLAMYEYPPIILRAHMSVIGSARALMLLTLGRDHLESRVVWLQGTHAHTRSHTHSRTHGAKQLRTVEQSSFTLGHRAVVFCYLT